MDKYFLKRCCFFYSQMGTKMRNENCQNKNDTFPTDLLIRSLKNHESELHRQRFCLTDCKKDPKISLKCSFKKISSG